MQAPVDVQARPWAAALRELMRLTRLEPQAVYSAEYLERYYDLEAGEIALCPAFVAVAAGRPAASPAADVEWRWCSLVEALELAPFPNQHGLYRHVWRYFVERRPSEHMRVPG